MKKCVIDTNALISFITDRNITQQQKIAQLFEEASRLHALIICPQNVLTEFVFVMDRVYGVPRKKINAMIKDFLDTPGIEIVHEINYETLLALWPDKIADYGDAIVAAACKDIRGSQVATFDAAFRSSLKKLSIPVLVL